VDLPLTDVVTYQAYQLIYLIIFQIVRDFQIPLEIAQA